MKGAGGATDTLPDGGSMRSWREDEDEDLRPARRRSQGTGMAALVLAVVAVLAAGVFLYHRLQRAEARASRHDGVARGAAAAVIASR